jgi:uncharacterized protein YjiK
MKTRIGWCFLLFTLIVGLGLFLTGVVRANNIEPPDLDLLRYSGSYNLSPSIDLGDPGLSFYYVKTFGITEHAYPSDTQHVNRPEGLFIDGDDNIYVAEDTGRRVMKYNLAGEHQLTLGTAGLYFTDERLFSTPQDVAVDVNGDIWVADNNRVVQYVGTGVDAGTFVQQLPESDAWEAGNDNTHFDSVRGITFDSLGRMYVSDRENHRIQVYTFSVGSPIYSATIGVTDVPGDDNDHFNKPYRLAVDSSDRLYVADSENDRVQRCTYSGMAWNCTTFANSLNSPRGIAIDTSESVYIADSSNGRIHKCAPDGSCDDLITGLPGWSTDVAVDSEGHIYVSDWTNHVVREYDSSGTLIDNFVGVVDTPYVTDNSHLNSPYGVAVDSVGSLYVTEKSGYRLVKFDAHGVPQWSVGQAGIYGDDNEHLGNYWSGPLGVAVGPESNVYVVDSGNHRVQIYDENGNYVDTLGEGNWGAGDYQFDDPHSVAVDGDGNIYVADHLNHRIQIYDSDLVYRATLGETGVSGTDNAHFDRPHGVAVDSAGNVYVADTYNNRVQKCTVTGDAGTCARFAGVTGEAGDDFDHFSTPYEVTVDHRGHVYVTDPWNDRIQVFDSDGAYLTTVGGLWGSNIGRFRTATGVTVDNQGNLYIADKDNHRVQKFAPIVPGWEQINLNGFGDADNWGAWSLGVFSDTLYVSTGNYVSGTEVYRFVSNSWEQVVSGGFGDNTNLGVDWFAKFNGDLYAATWNGGSGGQIWRSSTGDSGSWEQVMDNGFGDAVNVEVMTLAPFKGHLYAGTWSGDTDVHGGEVWRSDTGDNGSWTQVVSDTVFGGSDNVAIMSFEVFDGYLYAVTSNGNTGGEVWRTDNGITWTQVYTDGFGNADNARLVSLEVFDGQLYAGTHNQETGGEIWRTSDGTTWERVIYGGFDGVDNRRIASLVVFDGNLYAFTGNFVTGPEVWRSPTGDSEDWDRIADIGFGGGDCNRLYWDNVASVAGGRLYIGTTSSEGVGGRVWRKTITADFTASLTEGFSPLTIVFTNTSSGDYTEAWWDYGDGEGYTGTLLMPPSHVYTATGSYTVSLTVSDGVITNTRTRENYIRVLHGVYLPLVIRNNQ